MGVPFNIASYAILCQMLAQICGYSPGVLTMQFGDVHLYLNHIDQAQEQLNKAAVALSGGSEIYYPRFTVKEGALESPTYLDLVDLEDFEVTNYRNLGRIVAPISV